MEVTQGAKEVARKHRDNLVRAMDILLVENPYQDRTKVIRLIDISVESILKAGMLAGMELVKPKPTPTDKKP